MTFKKIYEDDEKFRDHFKILVSLCFVPVDDVPMVFNMVMAMEGLHPDLKLYVEKYYKETWISKPNDQNGQPRNARYPPKEWNVFQR